MKFLATLTSAYPANAPPGYSLFLSNIKQRYSAEHFVNGLSEPNVKNDVSGGSSKLAPASINTMNCSSRSSRKESDISN